MHDKRTKDRRIQKTRTLLHEALESLIREKPYDAIVVKEILDRANVGRSTFYTHFRDKDDLLVSGIHDMLGSTSAGPRWSARRSEHALKFSRPIFEHIDQHRRDGGSGMNAASRAIVHERLRQVITELIAEDVGQAKREKIPLDLLIKHVASSFVVVLDWWVESESTLSPAEVDALFRQLVLPSLAAALD